MHSVRRAGAARARAARPGRSGHARLPQRVYRLLREMHDFVLIDTPPSFTPEVIGAVDGSSEVCLVAMLDSLSLKNTKLGLETLERMDYPGRVRLVLNRADSTSASQPRTSSRSWVASPTCWCRATATSPARSTRASRSRWASAARMPRARSTRSRRMYQADRDQRRRRTRTAGNAGGSSGAAIGASMELHERLCPTPPQRELRRPAPIRSPRSRTASTWL